MTVYRFAGGSERDLTLGPDFAVLGLDAEGYVVVRCQVSPTFAMTYALTACCQASAKGCDGYIGCRSCYAEVDPKLGGPPDPIAFPVLDPAACCDVGPNACRLLRRQGEDCCPSCIHPRTTDPTIEPSAPAAAPPKENTAMTAPTAPARAAAPAAADQYRDFGLTDEAEWTPAMRLAVRQKWSGLPLTTTVGDLRAQLAAVQTAAVPSVDELVTKAFTRDEATVEHARLLRNAKVNAWRERGRLRAALEARDLKFAKLRASAKKAKVPPLDDETVEAITDLTAPAAVSA